MPDKSPLIEYLSKEIETHTNNMMTFRVRINMTIFIGPFVALGGVLIATNGVIHSLAFDSGTVVLGASLLFVGYVVMGMHCAGIEQHTWDQCNEWRSVIARIANDPEAEVTENDLRFEETLIRSYVLVYVALLVAFVGAYFLLLELAGVQ